MYSAHCQFCHLFLSESGDDSSSFQWITEVLMQVAVKLKNKQSTGTHNIFEIVTYVRY